MTHDDDKPLTPAQARQKLQKGLEDYLAGNGPETIVFRLKRTKKANDTYPLKLTQQQRETLLECTQLSRNLKKKIEQAGEGTQIVPVTWNELHKLNDETGQAAFYARSPHKKRLMAVMSRVVKFFEEEHAEVFDLDAPTPATTPGQDRSAVPVQDHAAGHQTGDLAADSSSRTAPWSISTSTSRRRSAGRITTCTSSRSTACGTANRPRTATISTWTSRTRRTFS